MATLPGKRIESIDLLKGLVMVIMALDHTRDYFHSGAFLFDPTDPSATTLPIYFTRWITHYCAPAFSFLAGLSAFFVGKRKSIGELSGFLLKRGLWLVFIEMTVVNFAWYFDVQFRTPGFLVIWSLGISMLVLAALVYLPRKIILIFSCIMIFGHNLLDTVHFEGSIVWAMIHELTIFKLSESYQLYAYYPIIPWIAVMSLGYCFGPMYDQSFDSQKRKGILTTIGMAASILFVIVRGINVYGDPVKWTSYDTTVKTMMSFLNPAKYPPSLSYLLMTLGPSLLFLAYSENLKNGIAKFFSTFGRVPFFYYILHIYLIHGLAMVAAQLTGFGWHSMILNDWVTEIPSLKGFGFSLWFVYAVWAGVVVLLYPLCVKFDRYKSSHREKWWLSYL
ncbi:MAG: heparan-alpha-glucosaminide N-acetyltransferase domain-containing protein [Cyclobacteriaceae bacterium]|nr:heparan-alpha-glucosaminide N-acetyltransferase domain-containing protein [Cyclobacteriaceae bacterium]MDH4298707.1 heparan-alpha-glucosaminide N-acetyltransferase domain-containing protein [Cyclobacteriaceae bacterium]MDH5247918.1 heparan-alpha-glucosaminide N-acetyltransferase domain-containing protein [Cyclobacteriaceae bacterium]